MAVAMTISSVSSVAVVGISRSLAVAVAMSMTISSVSSVAIVGVSISRPLAIAIAVVTISAIASVARLSSSVWLSNSHSSCLSLPLAIAIAMVSIPAISVTMAVTISTIAIARLSSSG